MIFDVENNIKITIKEAIKKAQFNREHNISDNKETFKCIECGEYVAYKNGLHNKAHFSHKNNSNCDYFNKNNMCEWHYSIQDDFSKNGCLIEQIMLNNTHRADVLISNNLVIELQHSYIDSEEFIKRNNDYLSNNYKLYWLFDYSEFYNSSPMQKEVDKKYKIGETTEYTCSYCNNKLINGQYGIYCKHCHFSSSLTVKEKEKIRYNNRKKISKQSHHEYWSKMELYKNTSFQKGLKIKKNQLLEKNKIYGLKISRMFATCKDVKNNKWLNNPNFKFFIYLDKHKIFEVIDILNKGLEITNVMTLEEWEKYCINKKDLI